MLIPRLPLLSRLGLRTSTNSLPHCTSQFLLLNFFITYVLSSSRFAKSKYDLDHNVAPREDLAKYGDQAVASGKITQSELDKIRRQEAAQANAIEHFPVFAAAMTMATMKGVDAGMVNTCGVIYTVARVAYIVAYVRITDETTSYIRSVLWWFGNLACIKLLWSAGKMYD